MAERARSVEGRRTGDAARVAPSGHRVILHVDMDAFFASVEVLDDPSLAGQPVIVGGNGRRGVVAACTYEARRFGVHSAMPSSEARRRCPSAIFVEGHYHRYAEVSGQLHAILRSVTPLVEGISLDEAFLDVTGARRRAGDGATIARGHPAPGDRGRSVSRARSAWPAPSWWPSWPRRRPSRGPRSPASSTGRGSSWSTRRRSGRFLRPLPVRALPGVGPATARRLHDLGVLTVGDLADLPVGTLGRAVGRAVGGQLVAMAHGEDPRPVVPEQAQKSIGHEETFATDLWEAGRPPRPPAANGGGLRRPSARGRPAGENGDRKGPLLGFLPTDPLSFARRPRRHRAGRRGGGRGPAGVDGPARSGCGSSGSACRGSDRRTGACSSPSTSRRRTQPIGAPDGDGDPARMPSDGEADHLQRSWQAVAVAVDSIRARYGGTSVGPASLVTAGGLALRRRGDAPWGPERVRSHPSAVLG